MMVVSVPCSGWHVISPSGPQGGGGFDQAVTFELAEHVLYYVLRWPDAGIGDLVNARSDRLPVDADLIHYEVIGGLASVQGSFRLDPADQVFPADPIQQGRMVGGHVPPDHPDHLVVALAAGYEPAFASDQLHPCASCPGCLPQRNARMLA
jgi:hypothetical protein